MAELLQIDLSGIPQWQHATQQMIDRAQNLAPVFEVMHEAWLVEMTEQFATEGAYYLGVQWAPLSPEYAKRKARKFGPMPILIATGALLKSLVGEGGDHVKEIGPANAVFGTRIPYAQYHQTGTPGRFSQYRYGNVGGMPARQLIKATDQLKQVGFHSAVKYILTGDARRGH